MKNYFLRFIEADKPAVRALGILLGELHDTEDGVSLVGNGFVDIGVLTKPTGQTVTDEDGNTIDVRSPIVDDQGRPYLHANLRTEQDLRAVAESLAASNPDLAAALSDLGRFFLLDENGQPRTPSSPQVVFA